MTEWMKGNEVQKRASAGNSANDAARRLPGDAAARQPRRGDYDAMEISERHRHRYEVNTGYRERLEQHGMRFSAMSPDGLLPEMVEYENHPWFIGVQFHPELKSRPFAPHPLFASFVEAAVVQSRLV